MCCNRRVLSKGTGGVCESASQSDTDLHVVYTHLTRTHLHLSAIVCVNHHRGEEVISANTSKTPAHVASCDKRVAYRRLWNIKLPSFWQGLLKKKLRGAEAWIKALHKSSVAGGLRLSVALCQTVEAGEWESERWGGEWRSAAGRTLILPFECKAVTDVIAGVQLQHQSEMHCPLGLKMSREWITAVVEIERQHTHTHTSWLLWVVSGHVENPLW